MVGIANSENVVNANDMNIPTQVAQVTDTTGKIKPIWFRYEDPVSHEIMTIDRLNVLSQKEINYVGFKMIQFVCSAQFGEMKRLFELRYNIGTHKWTLYQMLD